MSTPSSEGRREELERRLAAVERRLAAACRTAGRERASVTLVAVTKTFPAEDVALLAALGVRDVGEARDQEAAAKHARCRDLAVVGLTWHLVGQVQTNKARSVASYADVVHSVDRERLARALGRGAVDAGRTVTCLLQVHLGEEQDKVGALGRRGGAAPDELPVLADVVASTSGLRLGGVMAVAPPGADPRATFDRLRELRDALRRDHPQATVMSAGMSGDLEEAVVAGATHVRVGRAVLGSRPPLR